ncbi:class I SAM-dependent RNA methyltransferase [Prochlorococcus marinus]|uniref:RNA methyltransferase n=1 Tax=Prochlorococcus marinus XMU1408 TaxID=2213228 RepID=A0A318R5S0_PROMR|nr:class I SAM-dependent RNA methyltransferase [Prochlorococcus marinus]MBW3041110.1 RNA methyltransferase [Prochlorococcus marinus str. XMU1408]PYE03713.1 RNA methyltransferase [Prochlorococcus marinus XMU1408]
MKCVASISQGLEKEGAKELIEFGAFEAKASRRHILFEADMACLYRLHLRARLSFRFLREICRFPCHGPGELYDGIQTAIDWETWLLPKKSFRVSVTGIGEGLSHSHYTALQVKNAIIDFQRERWGFRSNIDLNNPDMCFHLHLAKNQAVLSVDGSNTSLHKRGYRPAVGIAPIKESLAAGLMRMTGWDGNQNLVDPLCGSGTFLIEAVSTLFGISPGINRKFLFQNWPDFDINLWNSELKSAQKVTTLDKQLPKVIGCEFDQSIATSAMENVRKSGLENYIEIINCPFQELQLPPGIGFLVCNPPYGKRIGDENFLPTLYKELGDYCKTQASGWDLWLLNGNPKLSQYLGMKASRRFQVNNGSIDCRWINYKIN